MTFEEAKKILEKEFAVIGLHKSTEPFEFDDSNWFGYEKPSVLEAFRVLSKEGYYITISGHDYDMRKKRLEKEYEENNKAPGSAENLIKEDSGVNPALAESATQFNDALLDEQGKKIKRLGKEIARLNKIIHKKNLKIDEMRKESSRHLEGKMKMFGENFDLEQELKDKNAVLSDVAEELRLSKIREKNLTEVCQKYMKENEELREKLAEKDEELTESKKRIEWVRNSSKEYCDYGVAANEFIKELAGLYVLASNNGNIDVEMLERCKNYQTYGFPANCNRETKKEINDIARGKTKVVGVDIAEEGADHSGVTVLCGKDCIDDIIKKMK